MDVEISIMFNPAPQRSIKASNEKQDTMVVVGQATQKRKRPKVSADVIDASPGKKTKEKIKITNGVEAKD